MEAETVSSKSVCRAAHWPAKSRSCRSKVSRPEAGRFFLPGAAKAAWTADSSSWASPSSAACSAPASCRICRSASAQSAADWARCFCRWAWLESSVCILLMPRERQVRAAAKSTDQRETGAGWQSRPARARDRHRTPAENNRSPIQTGRKGLRRKISHAVAVSAAKGGSSRQAAGRFSPVSSAHPANRA